MKHNNNEPFEYTYSPKQQEEIEKIRKKYLPKEDDKMELLRKLDQDTTKPGTICSIAVGVIGSLIFGFGMCCILVWADSSFALGILLGIIGMVIMGCAHPLHKQITKRQREKLAPQILALSEELLK